MNFIIDFEQSASQAQIDQYLADNNLTTIKVYDNFENVYLVDGAQPPMTAIITSIIDDDATTLELLDVVDVVDNAPEFTFDTTEQNWWKMFSLRKADLDAPTITMKMKGDPCAVYLVDSGIDATHPEFNGVNITNLFSVTGTFEDVTGHGTALASVIAGKTCAISNPHLKIVKIFDQTGSVKQSQLLAAMDAIINDVLANPNKVSIANMSWAIAKNNYIEQKLQVMMNHAVIVVAAAGNSGVAIEDVTPASMDEVITIGAFNQELQPCDFSNYTGESVVTYTDGSTNGGALDGWAPGDKIWVAKNGGGYGWAVGTSLAAAIHSAICAYNCVAMLKPDGGYIPSSDSVAAMVKQMSLSREGLVSYTDPKYDNSVNKMSTCHNEFTADARVPKPTEIIRFFSGKANHRRVFNPLLIKSYELIGQLPDGIEMYNGSIYGTPTIADDVDYAVTSITLNLTAIDDSTITQTVHFYVQHEEFDASTLPQDDPVLSVMSLYVCGDFSCAGCDIGEVCACGNPKAGGCYCLCDFCDCY